MLFRSPGETNREWGVPIEMTQAVKEKVDAMWDDLGIPLPNKDKGLLR